MKGGKRQAGYTIIEVMIVLAVSGVMFVIAASFVSGKQAKAAFTEGTNEFASQLQTIIAQVTDGQYTDVGLNCIYDSATKTTTVGLGTNKQGTNSTCVFLGKALYLAHGAYGPNYQVLSLAAGRVDSGLPAGTTITPADVSPAVIDSLNLDQVVPQSLDVTKVTEVDSGGGTHTNVGIAFLQGLGAIDTSGDLAGGAQSVGLYYISGLTPTTGSADALIASGSNLKPAESVTICVSDGSRYATLTLGGTTTGANPLGSTLSVAVKVVTIC